MLNEELKSKEKILSEIWEKHGEHLEMLPTEDMGKAMIPILVSMLEAERNKVEYYRKLLCKY